MIPRTQIARVLVGIVVAAVTAAPAYARAGPPPAMSSQQYQAMMLRSQALNLAYGVDKPQAMTHAQYRAELIRSTALNERHGIAVDVGANEISRIYATGTETAAAAAAPTERTTTTSGFDWRDAGIGAAVIVGVLAVGAAGGLALRRHGHFPHVPHVHR